MFELNNVRPASGATKKRKRVGRGPGSGHGKTSGRGMKGHSSRSGGGSHGWFEGGQMPLYRRIPKRGFHNPHRVENQIVNLSDFERFEPTQEITVEYLKKLGLVAGAFPKVKILGVGELTAAFRVRVHGASESAKKKIEAKGGTVEIVAYEARGPRGQEPADASQSR